MEVSKPIKRHEHLKEISRDHHHGLLLSWKIRNGLSKNIAIERIKKYADWFYLNYLLPHFELEEKYLFPILGQENEKVKRAVSEHKRLSRLFEEKIEVTKSISLIEEELESHIRFEERILFNEIQEKATTEELLLIEKHHDHLKFKENIQDEFWK